MQGFMDAFLKWDELVEKKGRKRVERFLQSSVDAGLSSISCS